MDVTINNVNYAGVPRIDVPKTAGGTASFYDTSEDTVEADSVLEGVTFHGANGKGVGTHIDAMRALMNGLFDEVTYNLDSGFTGTCWGISAFSSGRLTINLPNTVTAIGSNAFYNVYALKAISGAGVTNVSYNAFFGAKYLETVNFPNVTEINDSAFMNCETLANLKLPLVATIPSSIVAGCTALTDLWLGNNAVVSFADAEWGSSLATGGSTLTVHVPSNLLSAYQADTDWQMVISKCAESGLVVSLVGDYV